MVKLCKFIKGVYTMYASEFYSKLDKRDEVWKIVPGTDGKYEASTLGGIRKTGRKNWIRVVNRNLKVCLNGWRTTLPAVILTTFTGPRPRGAQVVWGEDIPAYDCRLQSISWGGRRNQSRSRLTNQQVRRIRFHHRAGKSMKQLAEAFDVSYQTVRDVCNGVTYKWLE
jgi:hypothetical protein